MDPIEKLRFFTPGTSAREGGEKMQPFNRYPSHRLISDPSFETSRVKMTRFAGTDDDEAAITSHLEMCSVQQPLRLALDIFAGLRGGGANCKPVADYRALQKKQFGHLYVPRVSPMLACGLQLAIEVKPQ